MDRKILHIDVNNAFLSWTAIERLKNGETLDIRTIPSIIGGDEKQRKGVVLAKSNLAKQFGIRTGEPIYFARKKCPSLRIYQGEFKVYRTYSNLLYQLLLEYTDQIERFSIDECFLDLTHFLRKGETLLYKAQEISARVKEELGFTVNIGLSTNKLLAKMASDFEKPDKIHTLYLDELPNKMWKLPVSELFMVGKKSIPKLEKMGITTIGDLAKRKITEIKKAFGKYGETIWEYANGIDKSPVLSQPEKPKCISNSVTLPHDISEYEKLQEVLLALVEQVTFRLRKEQMLSSIVNVQIKTNQFIVYSHQRKLFIPTDITKQIYEEAKKLLKELFNGSPVRLIGLRVEGLTSNKENQLCLFSQKEYIKQQKLDKILDDLKQKYGYNSIKRAGKINVEKIIKFKE